MREKTCRDTRSARGASDSGAGVNFSLRPCFLASLPQSFPASLPQSLIVSLPLRLPASLPQKPRFLIDIWRLENDATH
jgi:hypothetical protein